MWLVLLVLCFLLRTQQPILVSFFELPVELVLPDDFVPLVGVVLLDLEDLLAREEGVLLLVLVMLLSLLHSSTIMGMVRVQSMCLPLFWVGNGFLGLALYVCLTHSARFGAKTLSVRVSVGLLEESQVNTEDLLDVVVLSIRLLLKL